MTKEVTNIPKEIFNYWIHSYEEDEKNIKVFHTENFDFPLSRGRRGFELKKDGQFFRYDIGPNDLPKKVVGKWQSPVSNKIVIIFAENIRPDSFSIVSCTNDTLHIKVNK